MFSMMNEQGKIIFPVLFVFQLLVASCDMQKFAAGSYPYAEHIIIACPGDSVVKRLTALKASGRYNYSEFFVDGPGQENPPWYNFYFFSRKNNFLLHLNVVTHTSKAANISLINIKDFGAGDQWLDINRKVSDEKQREVFAWFEQEIRPALTCRNEH